MEIYAFGSVVRGEVDKYSDIDLLILKKLEENINEVDKSQFSIYTFQRITELWNEGNPFAWHLFIEAKCIYTPNSSSFLKSLGTPQKYDNTLLDLHKFYELFRSSKVSILNEEYSIDFDLSMIFLAIRNFASCFSLGFLGKFQFSRDSALSLGQYSIQIAEKNYERLKESRLLSTRGLGNRVSKSELNDIVSDFPKIEKWFNELLTLVR